MGEEAKFAAWPRASTLGFPHPSANFALIRLHAPCVSSGAISPSISTMVFRAPRALRRGTAGRGPGLSPAPVSAFPGAGESPGPRPWFCSPDYVVPARKQHQLQQSGRTRPTGRSGTRPGQAESAALMRALTAPMSALPAACAFTTPMTLPMSLTDAAPVDAMAALIRASTSASESCSGR